MKITSLDAIEFLDTHVCINNPHWQSSAIIILLCKYYIVISDTLEVSFLDVRSLLLGVTLSELHEKPRRNKELQKKAHRRICSRTSFFWLHDLLSISFVVAFFVYSLPFHIWCTVPTCWMAPMKIHNIVTDGILCDDIMRCYLAAGWRL